jgi:hypothetical protein
MTFLSKSKDIDQEEENIKNYDRSLTQILDN